MSAYLDPRIGILYYKENLTPEEKEMAKAMIASAFDETSDYDAQAQAQQIEHEKKLRKFYIFKMMIFPFEWILIRVLMGPIEAYAAWDLFKKTIKAYRGDRGGFDAQVRQATKQN